MGNEFKYMYIINIHVVRYYFTDKMNKYQNGLQTSKQSS